MASRHPLDVFQSSSSGFERASRRRRTISGKVITHRVRESEEGPAAPERETPDEAPTAPDQAGLEHEAPRDEAAVEASGEPREPVTAEAPPVQAPGKDRPKGKAKNKGKTKGKTKGQAKARPEAPASLEAAAPAPAEPRKPTRITGAAARPGRLTPAPAATAAAPAAPTATGQPPAARRPRLTLGRPGPGLSKVLLGGTVAAVLALVVWIGVKSFTSGDDGPELAVLNKNEALGQPEAPAQDEGAVAAATLWTIQAASYHPTENGQRMAWDALDELEARGYADVLVSGQQGQDEAGRPELTSCVLLVGRSTDRDQLEDVLARLVAVGDWPHGSRRPFTGARIVEHPHP